MKAQQNSLLVRHQQKDAVIQNIAELPTVDRRQAQRMASTSRRHKTARTNDENGGSVPHVGEVDKKQMSRVPRPETHANINAVTSQASTVHRPPISQPTTSVHRPIGSSGYKAKHVGHRMTSDVSAPSASPAAPFTASPVSLSNGTQSRLSDSLPSKPAVVRNSSEEDPCKMYYNSSVSRSSAVSDISGKSLPVKSLVTESALPLVYIPPVTITVTSSNNPLLSCAARSPCYFERLDGLQLPESSAIGAYDANRNRSSEQSRNSSSVPSTKPNCVFASKSVIATTYLRRRPPIFSPVCVETRTNSDNGQSHTDRNSAHSDCSTSDDSTQSVLSLPIKLSASKRNSFTVASPEVPPRLSSYKGQSTPCSSPSKLPEAVTSPQVSEAELPSVIRIAAGIFSSANSTENCASSPLTDAVVSSDSLPGVVIEPSAVVPYNTLSATDTSSLLSVFSSKVPSDGTISPASVSSDLFTPLSVDVASVKLLPETIRSNVVMFCPPPQVSASLSDVVDRFPGELTSSVVSSCYADTVPLTAVVDVNALSEVTKFLHPDQSEKQLSTKLSASIPLTLNVPSVCCAMPCTLTISTHIPVSSPSIDSLRSSLCTTSSRVVSNTASVAVSSSCDPCSTTVAGDILSSSIPSVSLLLPSSESSGELNGEVTDHCSPLTVPVVTDAPQLFTGSSRTIRRQQSSDSENESHGSSHLSHADGALEQISIGTVVDKTAEECSVDKQNSVEYSEVDADASSDDASSDIVPLEGEPDPVPVVHALVSKQKQTTGSKMLQRVSFSPLALLLDASLEGDLGLVIDTAKKVS